MEARADFGPLLRAGCLILSQMSRRDMPADLQEAPGSLRRFCDLGFSRKGAR